MNRWLRYALIGATCLTLPWINTGYLLFGAGIIATLFGITVANEPEWDIDAELATILPGGN